MRDLQRQIEQQVSVDSHQGINTFIIEVVKTIKRVSFTSTYNTRVTGEKIVQSRFFWTRFRVLDSQFKFQKCSQFINCKQRKSLS